jgi:heme A synthase
MYISEIEQWFQTYKNSHVTNKSTKGIFDWEVLIDYCHRVTTQLQLINIIIIIIIIIISEKNFTKKDAVSL